MNPIYLIGGSKGGVGKSMVALALVDFFASDKSLTIIDTDTSNPDVFKTYNNDKSIYSSLLDLDKADGWIQLVNVCEERPDDIIIVNTAARNNIGVQKYGETLKETLVDLKRDLITLWVINRQRDSLELLRSFMDVFKDKSTIHVLRNNYFGEESKFELYNTSKTRELVESNGGKSLNFPDLADRVSDDLYSKRMSIQTAMTELPLGNKAELRRWKTAYSKMFEQI